MRLLLVPLIILSGWLSWWSILLNPWHKYRPMLLNCWGLFDDKMDTEWTRVKFNKDLYHNLKNIGAEWNTEPSQRGYKIMSWFLINSFIVGAFV